MKIALITDTHWGVRGDSIAFIENAKTFLDNVFFPYLIKHKIKTVIHLGDLLDRRKYVNYYTASRLRKDFLERLAQLGITMHWILGNHDIFYRNDNSISAASELASGFKNINWYPDPKEMEFDRELMLFVPWICENNRAQTNNILRSTNAPVVMGHLELSGFEMQKGQIHADGEATDNYRRFSLVCSGHYHHSSRIDNIFYLGASGEYTWADYNDPRGFHIFDNKTIKTEFIQNPYTMFEKVFYDDTNPEFNPFKNISPAELEGKFVKLIVRSQTNTKQFNGLLAQIEGSKPAELSIVQDHLNMDKIDYQADPNIIPAGVDGTQKLIKDFIEQNQTVNQEKLDRLMATLYAEATNLG